MKKLLFFTIIFFVSGVTFADYCVSKNGTGVKVLYPIGQSCEDYAKEIGAEKPEHVGTLPPRADRKYWTLSGKDVVVDSVAKQADIDKETQLEADKAVVLGKLKISKEEYEKLNEQTPKAVVSEVID